MKQSISKLKHSSKRKNKTTESRGGGNSVNNKRDNANDDWLTALVQKASASASASASVSSKNSGRKSNNTPNSIKNNTAKNKKRSTNDDSNIVPIQEHEIVLSKEERIERRENKKRRRMMEKEQQQQWQQQKQLLKEQQQMDKMKMTKRQKQNYDDDNDNQIQEGGKSKRSLLKLSNEIKQITSQFKRQRTATTKGHSSNTNTNTFSLTNTPRGKATSKQQLTHQNIQPRKNDYNGLGLARPSLLILLRDESFIPKFEQEFKEHIDGFFGKQRTKAMKRQLDGNMLWRRLLKDKEDAKEEKGRGKKKNGNYTSTKNIKWNGKNLADMQPDERVEAMIQLNMI